MRKIINEVDPTGRTANMTGAKLDAGKPDLRLLLDFKRALTAVGEVCTYGSKKYTEKGWLHVPNGVNRYTSALLRHIFAEAANDIDDESGLLHAQQVAWNALARLELILINREESMLIDREEKVLKNNKSNDNKRTDI